MYAKSRPALQNSTINDPKMPLTLSSDISEVNKGTKVKTPPPAERNHLINFFN